MEEVAPDDISSIHIQSVVRAQMGDRSGIGVLEQFPRGPHKPSGVTGLLGGYRGMRMPDDLGGFLPVVEHPLQVTPQWVSAALRSGGFAGTVSELRRRRVGTGQMGTTLRVTLTWSDGTGPASVIVKFAAAVADGARIGREGNVIEVRFYTQLAPRLAVSVPGCYYGAFDEATSGFVLVLQDMAPAEQGDQIAGCSVDQARDAVLNVAGLHAPLWCNDNLRDLDWVSVVGPAIADSLQEYMVRFTEPFIERFDVSSEDGEILRRSAQGAATWIRGRQDRVSLIHADYRLDNLLFATDDTTPPVTAVDWANLAVGLPARDVAFLLETGLQIEDRRAHERDLVAAYGEELARQGVPEQPFNQLFDDYRFGLFQGPQVTVLGAMAAAVASERGEEMFRVMATRACAAIRDLDALDLLDATT